MQMTSLCKFVKMDLLINFYYAFWRYMHIVTYGTIKNFMQYKFMRPALGFIIRINKSHTEIYCLWYGQNKNIYMQLHNKSACTQGAYSPQNCMPFSTEQRSPLFASVGARSDSIVRSTTVTVSKTASVASYYIMLILIERTNFCAIFW